MAEAAMRLVTQFCNGELQKHMNCLDSHPRDWNKKCETTKMDLARCAQQNPHIQHIQILCSKSFAKYDECLESHPNDVLFCSPHLNAFLDCADRCTDKDYNRNISKAAVK